MEHPYNEILFTVFRTIEYSNKREELLIHGTTWMNFKGIILSARNQIQEYVRTASLHLYGVLLWMEGDSNYKGMESWRGWWNGSVSYMC